MRLIQTCKGATLAAWMLKQALPHAHATDHGGAAAAAGAKFQHGERVMVKWSKPSADGLLP
jgi:hypothetical protein